MTSDRSPLARPRAYLELVGVLAPWHREVVFLSLSDLDLARLDVAANPCSVSGSTGRALASTFEQYWATPAKLEDLFRLLVAGSSARPWAGVWRGGRASLHAFSDPFGSALLALNERVQQLDAQEPSVKGRRPDQARSERVVAPYTEIAARWLGSSVWPAGMEVGGVRGMVHAATVT